MKQSQLFDLSKNITAKKEIARKFISDLNDLKTTHPDIALEAFGWDPSFVSKGSKVAKSWKCPKGHIYKMRVAHRTFIPKGRKKGAGCRICNKGQKLKPTTSNNLKYLNPMVANEVFGVNTEHIYFKDRDYFLFKCPLGHFYKGRIWMQDRKLGNRYVQKKTGIIGCSVCQNFDIQQGINDLATKNPKLALEANGWDARKVGFNSHKKRPWKWSCGHDYLMSPAIRIKSGRAAGKPCPGCVHGGGFNKGKFGFLYLISKPGQFQFGVTNHLDKRVGYTHRKKGWDLIDCVSCIFGEEIWKAELALKKALKIKGIPTGQKAFREKFDGWTESFHSVDLEVKSLKDLFRRLSAPIPPFLLA
jgi:hypothetical protein